MKVLVIDDEPLVRRSLEKAFASAGHDVSTAPNADLGKKLWQSEGPDLVLLDVLMPGTTGPQLLQELRQDSRVRTTKVVLMSAFAASAEQARAESMVCLFIQKPFADIFQVVSQCEQLLRKS